MTAALRQLLTLDARPALADGPLTPLRTWTTSMERGATALADAAPAGSLQLGLRTILARHVLFHWNRMGFTNHQQAIWALAARQDNPRRLTGRSPARAARTKFGPSRPSATTH